MTENFPAHVEMTIALPLDVVANKLTRIEEELRSLNMKVLNFEQERENGDLNGLIGARLERIHNTLDSIRARLSRLDADIQPTRHATDSRVDDSSEYRKPRPDRDD
jgi:hypothetical protein